MRIDHVAFGWHDLDDCVGRFADAGLVTTYGGEHADGSTHMAIGGFADGSYLELIAPTGADVRPVRWPRHVTDDGGPAAWAVEVADVTAELRAAIAPGVPVSGPFAEGRDRPDGTRVEWDAGVVGPESLRQAVPFVIADRTPRSYRVTPTPELADSPLTGVAEVVLGVEDPEPVLDVLDRLYRLPSPRTSTRPELGAELHSVPGRPFSVAAPTGAGQLADRLDAYPASPCAYLLGTDDLDAAMAAFELTDPVRWPGGRVAWVDVDGLRDRIGVLTRE
ncbi:VOC family protein [Haloarchaeobius sp. HRN-SO-5]|uniref:VOC family protein n=1 Tax=Haloarchaeobius sp. HRN-SO-5 TaxID=3446118 RepID=UPI003EB80DCC